MAIVLTGDIAFKQKLFRVLQKNEVGAGQSVPFKLSAPIDSRSGWTFGHLQIDMKKGPASEKNVLSQVLGAARDGAGNPIVTAAKAATLFADISATKSLSAADVALVDAALQSTAGSALVEGAVDGILQDRIDFATAVINSAPQGDRTFLSGDIPKLWLCDVKNQGINGLADFLAGKTSKGATRNTQLGIDDLLNFYFHQRATIANISAVPWDPMRRFANLVNEAGAYAPRDLQEAKGVLRAYTFWYVEHENKLLGSASRVAAVNDFRRLLCKPADQLVLADLQTEYAMGAVGSYDDVLVGDDTANLDSTGQYKLSGRDGNDVLVGAAGNDILSGGTGADFLVGGADNDTLQGEAGNDTYVFKADEGTDTIIDSDGDGRILIAGAPLSGADASKYTCVNGLASWTDASGVTYSFQDNGTNKVVLSISGGALGTGIVKVNDFDISKPSYLGITLTRTPTCLVKTSGGSSPFDTAGFDPSTLEGQESSLAEGGGRSFTVFLNVAAKAGDTLTLAVGALSGKVKAILGDRTVDADGAVISLTEGQTEVSFAIVQDDDLDADITGSLKVTYGGGGESVESNAWNLTLKDSGETQNTVNGDLFALTVDHHGAAITRPGQNGVEVIIVNDGEKKFVTDSAGNLVSGGDTFVKDNTLFGSAANDKISGGIGNDLVQGGAGNDEIAGGDGDDMIGGGAGNDDLTGGDGNDYISSSADILGGRQHLGPNDNWANWGQPAGSQLEASGAMFGVYPQSGATVWNGISETSTDEQSDHIDAGAGDDRVIASWGDDRIEGGDGKDRIDALAGDDIVEGGDGDDSINGDGILQNGYLNTTAQANHGSDFIDGGEGKDEITGAGGSDDLFGGDGDDKIFGDVGLETDEEEFVAFAYHGTDYIDGEDGDDYAEGGGKDDTLYGGDGKDTLWGDQSADRLKDDAASDPIAHGDDYLDGEDGDDLLWGNGGADTLYGGAGDDQLMGDESNSALEGEFQGADYLDGEDGNDVMFGGGKDDTLFGGDGDDSMLGDDNTSVLAGEFHGADYLDGEGGADQLVGGGQGDTLYGGAGDDLLFGDDEEADVAGEFHGDDYLDGEDGNDQLVGGGKDDQLIGGAGNDLLFGDDDEADVAGEFHGADYLDGGEGNDQLVGGGQDDQLFGGAGNDLMIGDDSENNLAGEFHGADYLDGEDGDDQLVGSGGDDTLYGGTGDDVLFGDNTESQVSGQFHGDDYLDGEDGDDYLAGNGGADTLLGGEGNDTLQGDSAQSQVAGEFHGEDYLDGGNGNDFITGGGGNDTVIGGAGNDTLQGDASAAELDAQWHGDDYIDGGEGNDTLYGQGGNDTLLGGDGNDRLNSGDGNDYLDGGLGNDRFGVLDTQGTKTITDEGGTDVLELGWLLGDTSLRRGSFMLTNGSTGQQVHIEGFDTFDPDAVSPIEQFVMLDPFGSYITYTAQQLISELGFTFEGTEGDDSLLGTAFWDTIYAGSGDDYVDALQDNDIVYGEAGNDLLLGGEGHDTLLGGEDADELHGDTGDDQLYGDEGDDLLLGGTGGDVLDGGSGADTMEGGTNSDTYHVDSTGDLVIEQDEGPDAYDQYDRVNASISYALTDNVEELTLVEGADYALNGTGNALDNWITGNSNDNVLDGGAGYDVIYAGAGNDVLIGGSGPDYLLGGDGDDTFYTDGEDQTSDSDGTDIVYSTGTHAIGSGIENLTLLGSDDIDGYGNYENNVITGNAGANRLAGDWGDDQLLGGDGNDVLIGSYGADTLAGGQGDDTYVGVTWGYDWDSVFENNENTIVEVDGEGNDTVLTSGNHVLETGIENLMLANNIYFTDFRWVTGEGNGLDNTLGVVSTWREMDFGEVTFGANLFGLGGNDSLSGGIWDDVLDGGEGADTMAGGWGSDRYYVDNAGDSITEVEGHPETAYYTADNVHSSIDYTLGAHLENLFLLEGGAITGTGNELDNYIGGNANDNVLSGGDGADTIGAGDGNDVLTGDAGDDQLYGDNGDDLLMGGVGSDYLDGGDGADILSGGDGDDELDGGWNADVMDGGAGNDTYYVTETDDIASEAGGSGIDLVYSEADFFALGAGIENLHVYNYGAIGVGNELDNLLTGEYGDQVLHGMDGNDVFRGDGTSDTLVGGNGDDMYHLDLYTDEDYDWDTGEYLVRSRYSAIVEEEDGGHDSVVLIDQPGAAFVHQVTLADNVEDLDASAVSSGAHISGNGSDNTVYGTGASDVISGGDGADRLFGDPTSDDTIGTVGPRSAEEMDSFLRNLSLEPDAATVSWSTLKSTQGIVEELSAGQDEADFVALALTRQLADGSTAAGVAYWPRSTWHSDYSEWEGNWSSIWPETGNTVVVANDDSFTVEVADGTDYAFWDAMANWQQRPDALMASLLNQYGVLSVGDPSSDPADGFLRVRSNLYPGNDWDELTTFDWPIDKLPPEVVSLFLATVGDVGEDVLEGGEGDDYLHGGRGNDDLYGGDGSDVLIGGDGGLIRITSSFGTLLEGEQGGEGGEDLEDSGYGTFLTAMAPSGNDDYLDGGLGIDSMTGGIGNDTYVVDGESVTASDGHWAELDLCDTENRFGMDGRPVRLWTTDSVHELVDGGNDDWVYASASVVLDNIETVELSEKAPELDIDARTGDGVQTLIGNSGRNTLDGGAGADLMIGGAGNDTYVVDDVADTVAEFADEGLDIVRTELDGYVLGENLEALLLDGDADLGGSGNELDNILVGNTGHNVLEGGAGDDVLAGWRGDDLLLGGEGQDTYVFSRGDGSDVVQDNQSSSRLHFSGDILFSDLSFHTDANDLIIMVGTSDSSDGVQVTLRDWLAAADRANQLTFCADDDVTLDESLLNQAPVALDDTATALEDGPAVTGNVLGNDSDPDADTLTVVDAGVQDGQFGSLDLQADGEYSYSVDNSLADVQALGEGQTRSDTFGYTVTDGALTSSAQLTVEVVGVNDGPEAQEDTAAASEDGELTASGNVLDNDSDIDNGDVLAVEDAGQQGGEFGSLDVAADGSYTYTLDNSSVAVQSLGAGQQVADDFSYTVSDNHGATASSTLTVTVTGVNDGPVAQTDTASAQEDGAAATGNVLSNDSDIDQGDTIAVTATGALSGQYGSATIASDGGYSYAVDNASAVVQSLGAGQTASEVFNYTVADSQGATASSTLTVTVTGVNDGPVAQADMASVSEDGVLSASTNVLANDSDVDQGDTIAVTTTGAQAGQYGSATIAADGALQYTLDNASTKVQSLAQGQTASEVFSYAIADSQGAAATATVTVKITGTNDGPVATADTAITQEDGTIIATGNVLANDSDIDAGDVVQVTTTGATAGNYGSLTLAADGSYSYGLDNASSKVQALAAGQSASEVFSYTIADSQGATASSKVTVQITGANDGPVAVSDGASVSEDGILTAGGNVLANDSDIDAGDTLKITTTGNRTSDWGTLSLAQDGSYSYALNNASTKVQGLAAGQQVQDSFSYTVADSQGALATAQLTVTITGANEAVCTGLIVNGTSKNDNLKGSDCADRIDGKTGADTMTGGKGDDIYIVDKAFVQGNDCDPDIPGDKVVEAAGGGIDTVASSVNYVLPEHVENLMLKGTAQLTGTGNAAANVIVGSAGASTLDGAGGDDVLAGRGGGDTLKGGSGNDKLYGEAGSDKLYGGAGNDKLWGGTGNDQIEDTEGSNLVAAGAGNDCIVLGSGQDVVVAGAGSDTITAGAGNDFIDGGADIDCIDAGSGNDFIAGGKGNDTITSGTGRDVIAFNRGDGKDVLTVTSGDAKADTLSLGGGIRYADLTLRKSGSDLVLGLGSTDQITAKDWYAKADNHTIGALQMLTEGGDYNANSTNQTLNSKEVVFDFTTITNQFDAARAANSKLTTWALAPSLAGAVVETSNDKARGGDLAYDYATTYTATQGYGKDMDEQAVRTEVAGLNAGTSQSFTAAPTDNTVNPWVALQAGTDLVVSQSAAASNPIGPVETLAADALLFAAIAVSETKPTWAAQ